MKWDAHYTMGSDENEHGKGTTVAFKPKKTHKKCWYYSQDSQ